MSPKSTPATVGQRCLGCGEIHAAGEACRPGGRRSAGTDPRVPRFEAGRPGAAKADPSGAIAKYAFGDWSSDVKVSTDVRRALDAWRGDRPGAHIRKRDRGDGSRLRDATTDHGGRRSRGGPEATSSPAAPAPRGSHEDTVEVEAFELDTAEPVTSAGHDRRLGRVLFGIFVLVTAVGVGYALWSLT